MVDQFYAEGAQTVLHHERLDALDKCLNGSAAKMGMPTRLADITLRCRAPGLAVDAATVGVNKAAT